MSDRRTPDPAEGSRPDISLSELSWLEGLDPRVFTPHTWEHGRSTTIRLRSPDSSVSTNVARIISHYPDGNTSISDELYPLPRGGTEAGPQDVVGRYKYELTPEGVIVPSETRSIVSERLEKVVNDMRGLVSITGATVISTNYDYGTEAHFISDGTQWIDSMTERTVTYPKLPIARFPLKP